MRSCFVYFTHPGFDVDRPWDYVLPRTWNDGSRPELWDWIEKVMLYAGMDEVIASMYFRPGEVERVLGFLDMLKAHKSPLRLSLLYEPWDEDVATVTARLAALQPILSHPYYAKVKRVSATGRTVTYYPRLHVWQVFSRVQEEQWRANKRAYGKPLWLALRVRSRWQQEAQPVDDGLPLSRRIDARYQYPQPAVRDGSALPYAVSYSNANYDHFERRWLMPPVTVAEWRAALAQPVPAGASEYYRDGEVNEAGILAPASDPFGYLQAIRELRAGL